LSRNLVIFAENGQAAAPIEIARRSAAPDAGPLSSHFGSACQRLVDGFVQTAISRALPIRDPIRHNPYEMIQPVEQGLGVRLLRFAVVAAQLAAVGMALKLLHIEENAGLVELVPLLAVGFAFHAWLPRGWRLPFFAVLGVAGACWILGPIEGALLAAAGLFLIGLCHVPVPFPARIALVLLAAAALAALRAGWIETPWSAKVLPILGAMFMFRLVVYLYDLRHEQKPASPWARLSYFFMLPNVCFPLFPVVDYKTLLRTYYDEEDNAIYAKGVRWMLLGVVHLVLYRAVYLYLVPAPSAIDGVGGVGLFALSAYLQYLRISGQFHLVVGVLCLFGFNLPPTNAWYFFASSLTDMWRRINIYWKDFCQKIIYFPIFMRLRKRGATLAMVVATFAVFVLSWLLHSYQWFWIRGDFPITGVDIAFWGSVSLLVVGTVVFEARRAARGAPAKPPRPLAAALRRGLGILAVFAVMCILWSLWCSSSPSDWVGTMASARGGSAAEWGAVAGVAAGLLILFTAGSFAAARGWLRAPRFGFWTSSAITFAVGLALAGAGAWAGRVPPGDETIAGRLAALSKPRLNLRDAEARTLGYYEGLLDGSGQAFTGAQPSGAAGTVQTPADWVPLSKTDLPARVDDCRGYVLRGSQRTMFKRALLTTNEWGMRDKAYTKAKPAGVFRIALLGASPEMGSGVADGENYESVLEEMLNRERPGGPTLRYEVLNFAVAGYGVVQEAAKLEREIFEFEPDVVLVAAHDGGDLAVTLRLFGKLAAREIPLPVGLQRIVGDVDISGDLESPEVVKRLTPLFGKITRWGYRRIVDLCVEQEIIPVWVFVPIPKDFVGMGGNTEIAELMDWARDVGFRTINLGDAFEGIDPDTLVLAPWDNHPNVKGNEILAKRLYEELVKRPALLGIGASGAGTGGAP
jgi:D-alanyl-lipoteichoic acid acyltransferase DltB (MBOAT superfamily)